jgi:predicted Zn-dependent protease
MSVAQFALAKGYAAAARAASERAVTIAQNRESALLARAQLALSSNDAVFKRTSGRDLLGVASEPRSFLTAAEALLRAGDGDGANVAVDRAMKANPTDPTIVLWAARMNIDRGDYARARSFLTGDRHLVFTLEDRARVEELFADIAEKQGDSMSAAAARARARLLMGMKQQGRPPL